MRITVLPGDGIGPEVTTEAVKVLQTIADIQGFRLEFEEHLIGGTAIKESGSPLPRTTLDACLASDAVLLGAVGSPEYDRRHISDPKPDCCFCDVLWAATPTFDLQYPMMRSPLALPCARR